MALKRRTVIGDGCHPETAYFYRNPSKVGRGEECSPLCRCSFRDVNVVGCWLQEEGANASHSEIFHHSRKTNQMNERRPKPCVQTLMQQAIFMTPREDYDVRLQRLNGEIAEAERRKKRFS